MARRRQPGLCDASIPCRCKPPLSADDTTDACIRYNTVTNKWEGGIASMPHGVNHAAAGTDGKLMYVAGGRDGRNQVGNGFNYLQVGRCCYWLGLQSSCAAGAGLRLGRRWHVCCRCSCAQQSLVSVRH